MKKTKFHTLRALDQILAGEKVTVKKLGSETTKITEKEFWGDTKEDE